MNKFRAFTMIEVMIAIFIFSTGMFAFMAYHARANAMMFDNESSQIAHSLAINLAEEINSLTMEDSRALSEAGCLQSGAICSDGSLSNFFSGSFIGGPFDSFGKPVGGGSDQPFMFYRLVTMRTYNDITQSSNPAISQLGLLRHFEVIVAWPSRDHPGFSCDNVGYGNCYYVTIPVVKPISLP